MAVHTDPIAAMRAEIESLKAENARIKESWQGTFNLGLAVDQDRDTLKAELEQIRKTIERFRAVVSLAPERVTAVARLVYNRHYGTEEIPDRWIHDIEKGLYEVHRHDLLSGTIDVITAINSMLEGDSK